MKVFTIDANVFRAAQHFEALRDVRYYLNGVFVSKDGDVVATNGHCLFYSKTVFHGKHRKMQKSPVGQDLIIKLGQKVPDKAEKLRITVIDECDPASAVLAEAIGFGVRGKLIDKKIAGKLLYGKYPDFNRVIAGSPYSRENQADIESGLKCIGVNPNYIKKVAAVFGDSVSITMRDESSCLVFEPLFSKHNYPEGTKALIMPLRLK